MPDEPWRTEFPTLPHEPQDLDLIRSQLALSPRDRLKGAKQMFAFVMRARAGKWRAAIGEAGRRLVK